MTAGILLLARRRLRTHVLAAGVTTLAVAGGVASVLATQLLSASVLASHEATARQFAGRAALQVTNGQSGIPEEVVEEIRGVAGVRAAAPSVEAFVPAPDLPGERLYLYGIDLLADHEVREYGSGSAPVVSDPLVFLAAPDSVALTTAFAGAHGLGMLDRLRVLTPSGVVDLRVRALLGAPRGPASALDGRVAIVDLSVAQQLLRMEGRVSQVAVELDPDADVATLERELAARVGGRGVVERPHSRTAAFARLLASYRAGLVLAAAISLLVALYFVFNLATIAVIERRRELGLLRVVGLPAHGIVLLVLSELVMLAAVGSCVGVPVGVGLARTLNGMFADSVATLYGDLTGTELHVQGSAVLWSVVLGMVTVLLAVASPIRHAVRVGPLAALRTSATETPTGGQGVGAALVGGVMVVAAVATWLARTSLPITPEHAGLCALLGAVNGVALGVPLVVRAMVSAGERLATHVGRPLPLLACRNLHADVRRLTITCAAVLVGLAGSMAVGAWTASLDATLHAAFDTVFANVDLVVSSGADPFATEAVRIPAEVVNHVARRPEVAWADAIRLDTIAFEGSRAAIVAGDTRLYREGRRALYLVDGDPAVVRRDLASGAAVVVNQAFASRFHRRRGDVLALPTPAGLLRVKIAGIHLELTPGDLGTIHLDREVYRRWWRDTTVNVIALALRKPAERRDLIGSIRRNWGDRHRLVVLTVDELQREYRAMLGRLTTLVSPLLATAIASALMGVVSARVAAMIAARRVHGLLRVVGATRGQVARLCGLEGVAVAGDAAAMALVVGSGLGRLHVAVLLRGMLGLSVVDAYPVALAVIGAITIVVPTGAVGLVLGHRSARQGLGEVLRWE